VTEAEHMVRIIEPGTPMQKVIPPRLVEPYLTGRRSVIAGYVYRARDCAFHGPANFYDSLNLGYEGSDFTAELAEIYVMRWLALDMDSSLAPPPADSQNGLAPSLSSTRCPSRSRWERRSTGSCLAGRSSSPATTGSPGCARPGGCEPCASG
jgi:hypothetical protein